MSIFLSAKSASIILKKNWFARRRRPLFGRQFVLEAKLFTVMKEPVHWEVMPGLCFSLHLAHCHSICCHLAHPQTHMKTSKWYLWSEVIVFLKKKCHCCFIHLLCLIDRISQDARGESEDVIKLYLDKNAVFLIGSEGGWTPFYQQQKTKLKIKRETKRKYHTNFGIGSFHCWILKKAHWNKY